MSRTSDTLNGFVDSGCRIKGEITFENAFRVDGHVEGTIHSNSELIIGTRGVVEGEIHVARCLIGGSVRGSIDATESVTLHASAKVWADIHSPAIVMEEGAFLDGRVAMEAAATPGGPGKAPARTKSKVTGSGG